MHPSNNKLVLCRDKGHLRPLNRCAEWEIRQLTLSNDKLFGVGSDKLVLVNTHNTQYPHSPHKTKKNVTKQ